MSAMQQRLTLVTLGVRDLDRALSFYRALGWHESAARSVPGEVAFFSAGGMVLALWDRAKLAEDSAVEDSGGWGGVTLAYNTSSPSDVDALLELAARAGARIGRPGAPTSWGGYSGVFIDPDGHPWEVAVNPDWPLDPDGSVHLDS